MSLPRYPEYRDSGVDWLGQVPKHWPSMRLRHCVALNPSKSEVASLPRSLEVSFLPMEAIGDDGQLDLSRTRQIQAVETGYTYFRDGDVAFAKITPCFENGKGALMRGLTEGIGFGTTELVVLRADQSRVLPTYLSWVVRSPEFRDQGEASMYGAGGQKRVPDDFVRELPWPIPTKEEQLAISSFLYHETAKIDALIAEQEKLIALLAEKRQATISHAVTRGLNPDAPMKDSGVPWLGEVPAHWESKQLKHVAKPGTAITYGIVQAGPHIEGGIPYIKTSDMAGDRLPLDGYSRTSPEIDAAYSRSKVDAGDLVIAIRATVGKCLPVPLELAGANLTQGTAKVSPSDEVQPSFLLWTLRSSAVQTYFDQMAKGATFKEITLDALRRTPVLLPPKDEQIAIAGFIESAAAKFEMLAADAARAVELLKERRSALIAAAVTGQIDVRGWMPPQ